MFPRLLERHHSGQQSLQQNYQKHSRHYCHLHLPGGLFRCSKRPPSGLPSTRQLTGAIDQQACSNPNLPGADGLCVGEELGKRGSRGDQIKAQLLAHRRVASIQCQMAAILITWMEAHNWPVIQQSNCGSHHRHLSQKTDMPVNTQWTKSGHQTLDQMPHGAWEETEQKPNQK